MHRGSALNNLLLRKQLLVTEAEVHREQMRQDFQIIDQSIDSLSRKARSFGTIFSVISLVAGGVTALRGVRSHAHSHSQNGGDHSGLFSRLFSGVRLASTLWRGWNSFKHSRDDRPHQD